MSKLPPSALRTACRRHRLAWILTTLIACSAGIVLAQESAPKPPTKATASAGAHSAPQQYRSLAELSSRLVQTAASGQGGATEFRIDVAYYRETLRELMKQDAARAPEERLPKALLMDMVRMIALLQSAAQCQSGRYIVCPADLIASLERQQASVEKQMAGVPAKP